MPRVPNFRAIATKGSIASLCALAEQDGEVTAFFENRSQCYNIRNRIYQYRSKLRKQNLAVTGVEASSLDGFEFEYGPVDKSQPDGKWFFRMSYGAEIEFEIQVSEHHEGELPHFDTIADGDVPLLPIEHRRSADEEFHDTAQQQLDEMEFI
jgi:hypothetical protein